MFAKQASWLVIAVAGWPVIAVADPEPPPPPPPGEPTGYFQIGAGYATDEGFGAFARVGNSDLFHTGNELTLTAGISEREQKFDVHFGAPHLFGSDLSLGGDLYNDTRMIVPGLVRQAVGVAATAKQALSAHWQAWVGYDLENVTANPPEALARTLGPTAPVAAGLVSAVRAGIEYSTLDTRNLPTRGSVFGMSLDYADPHLGSDYEFARASMWAGTNQSLGPFRFHLGGTATAMSSPGQIPLTERLYLDGSSELRGFAPGAIGPLDGGMLKLTGRGSVELPICHGVSVEGFTDAAWIDGAHGLSTGFGAIWRSPIGAIHVDLAFPLGAPHPALVFGIGGMF
jgi:outer membrane protein assembly factor BamA